jgi:serine/threonine protein kinase
MSVVYRAKTKDTGKVVAVKTLRTQGLTDEMLVKRFQREAELLSRLNHPRIVNLHAYGTSARGQPYFVMDFLRGENLTDVLKAEDHLAPERFQDIFVQVCAAIEHAHKHNAIHRDIKPGNIMLTRQGRTVDYVKIVDFGIAMISEEASA